MRLLLFALFLVSVSVLSAPLDEAESPDPAVASCISLAVCPKNTSTVGYYCCNQEGYSTCCTISKPLLKWMYFFDVLGLFFLLNLLVLIALCCWGLYQHRNNVKAAKAKKSEDLERGRNNAGGIAGENNAAGIAGENNAAGIAGENNAVSIAGENNAAGSSRIRIESDV